MNKRTFLKSLLLGSVAGPILPHLARLAPATSKAVVAPPHFYMDDAQVLIITGKRMVGKTSLALRLTSPSLFRPIQGIVDIQKFDGLTVEYRLRSPYIHLDEERAWDAVTRRPTVIHCGHVWAQCTEPYEFFLQALRNELSLIPARRFAIETMQPFRISCELQKMDVKPVILYIYDSGSTSARWWDFDAIHPDFTGKQNVRQFGPLV
jgi:hypothetical protein